MKPPPLAKFSLIQRILKGVFIMGSKNVNSIIIIIIIIVIMAATNTYIACGKVPGVLPSASWTLSPLIAQITLGGWCLSASLPPGPVAGLCPWTPLASPAQCVSRNDLCHFQTKHLITSV